MPFDASVGQLAGGLEPAFAAIGSGGPAWDNRADALAWEYHVASNLLRLAEMRRKRAQAAAVRGEVLFDHEVSPLPVGSNQLVYAGAVVHISVAVAVPVYGIDHVGFIADLLEAGVDRELVMRLVVRHQTETRAAHKFTSSLVAG